MRPLLQKKIYEGMGHGFRRNKAIYSLEGMRIHIDRSSS